jgi:uncharacterized membrane protein YbaN (DUF454 family)
MTRPSPRPQQEEQPELPDLLSTDIRRPLWARALCVAGAMVCFVLGVIGWLIPLVTGLPFYALGLILLGMASARAARWINRLDRRLPYAVRVKLREWTRRTTKKR